MGKKRGLSPIIATILLMAFAVAIGALIMNWSSKIVREGMQEEKCTKASVSLRSDLCYTGDAIRVDVRNDGPTKIATLNLIIDSDTAQREITMNIDGLGSDEVLTQEVPTVQPENADISITPVVELEERRVTCEEPVHTTGGIPDC